MKLLRELVGGVGYTLVASMERKNPSYLQLIANPVTQISEPHQLSHQLARVDLMGISKLKRERIREEVERREEWHAPLEIDAPHRHGLLTLLKRRIGRTEEEKKGFMLKLAIKIEHIKRENPVALRLRQYHESTTAIGAIETRH